MPRRAPAGPTTRGSSTPKSVQSVCYLLEITAVDIDYSMSADRDSRLSRNGLVEHQHVAIRARLLSPSRYASRTVKMTLIGDRDLDTLLTGPETDAMSDVVGVLTLSSDFATYLGSLSYSGLWGLIPALGGRSVRYIVLTGSPIRYGKARIGSISFKGTYDPEDYFD